MDFEFQKVLECLLFLKNDIAMLLNFFGIVCELHAGARMSVSDGTLTIVAKNQSVMEKVQEKVLFHIYLYNSICFVSL